ncbi:AAA family ATPase [Kitasatospora sp. NPDC051853]|uniref:AAA family ATPase n=1 Tax=Kitasatospora sp. NPDC051853 TaxID=3364058 RepID=UPI003797D14F
MTTAPDRRPAGPSRPERFEGLRLGGDEPFTVLHGPGVDDVFLGPDHRVLTLEEALWGLLHSAGYQRVVFSSLSRPLYFRDAESRRLSRPGGAADGPAGARNGAPAQQLMGHRAMRGPLGRLRIDPDPPAQPPRPPGRPAAARAFTDPFAVMTHLSQLRQHRVRTAVVYTQAEEILLHNDAARQLAAALADHAQDRSGTGHWVFVFRRSTLEEVERIVTERQRFPALTAFLRARREHPELGGTFRVGLPDQAELGRLVDRLRLREGLRIGDWREVEPLLRAFASHPRRASSWREELRGLIADGLALDRRTVLERGLVTTVTPHDESPWARLEAMPGLEPVKAHLRLLHRQVAAGQALRALGKAPREAPAQHLLFAGNPGTGKTTVARLVGELYRDLGLLRRGHLVEVSAADLVTADVGGTAGRTAARIDEALDGVLFIDEAYALSDQRGGHGGEAITELVNRMDSQRERLVVVLAGYTDKMDEFLAVNEGMRRRIRARIEFPDYDPPTLHRILLGMLADRHLHPVPATRALLEEVVTGMHRVARKGFGNAGDMRTLADELFSSWAGRVQSEVGLPLLPEDLPEAYLGYPPKPAPSVEEVLRELDGLVGLAGVRDYLAGLTGRLAMRQARGLPGTAMPHLLFLGPPGTGKTTVARAVGRICHTLGLLHTDQVVEVTRAELVGRYLGDTALKTKAVVDSAVDKVLFIDEAYSLAASSSGQDYGQEAITTLLREMQEHPGRLVVIAAGYPREMQAFLDANSGLRSRFGATLHFPHYPTTDLLEMLRRRAAREGYGLTPEAVRAAARWFDHRRAADPRTFGNARSIEGLLERMETRMAHRLGPDGWGEGPPEFTGEDVPPPF